MTTEHRMLVLKLALIEAIDEWFEKQSDKNLTVNDGWVGYRLSEQMATAAMAVYEYGADVNKVVEENNE
jgi:hypothetical protein